MTTVYVDRNPSDLKFRVYVIALKPLVSIKGKWKDANPHQVKDECFYVGYTSHSAYCRFRQHRKSQGLLTVRCVCDRRRGELVKSRGNYYVKQYGLELADDRFHPTPRRFKTEDEAIRAEVNHAKFLRSQGYGVWQK